MSEEVKEEVKKVSNKRRYVGVGILIGIIAIIYALTCVQVYKTPDGNYTFTKPRPQLILTAADGSQVSVPLNENKVIVQEVKKDLTSKMVGTYKCENVTLVLNKDNTGTYIFGIKIAWYMDGETLILIAKKSSRNKVLPNGNILIEGYVFKKVK